MDANIRPQGEFPMTARFVMASLMLAVSAASALALAPDRRNRKEPPQLKEVQFPSGYCDLYLLAQAAVQKDLKLSADQVSAVQSLVADLVERKAKVAVPDHVQFLHKHQKTALSLLTPEQVQRLKQVSLQCKATASFWDADVRAALAVTDEQFKKMQTMPYGQQGDAGAAQRAAVRKDFLDFPKRAEENWQQREWARIAVLTPAQQDGWKRMLGRPFTGTFPTAVLVPVEPTKFDFDR
jgi:hypothetical protein